ncbi:hypothetical protein ITJ43_10995 [Microbacterium sp. VKM Ac-2870]|uniref:hypothetical protein n=1 Tax=Microbacterium sp. VKM Ac-2870 TaxID=2783825 RepID=UPI00188A59E7|nr:hypothetical protein [Microbacterium sp. VKM Ac-2870]MBF4562665.1 hypothetical protein [Microbacterium sp. VKM Ac-2870]
MNRILKVARMQFVNKYTFVWMPLIILVAAFVLSVIIFAMVPFGGAKYGGGSQAPIWYFFGLGIMSLSYTFPFSQALSITRREFFFGTMLAALLTASILGVSFAVGGTIERATGGWGVNGYFFSLDWVWTAGPVGAGVFFAVVAMLLFVIGFWGATIYRRFAAIGLTIALALFGLALVGGIWAIGRLDAWATVGEWLAGLGAMGLTAVLALAALGLGAASFLTLRRAIP